jgi:general stress protein 26
VFVGAALQNLFSVLSVPGTFEGLDYNQRRLQRREPEKQAGPVSLRRQDLNFRKIYYQSVRRAELMGKQSAGFKCDRFKPPLGLLLGVLVFSLSSVASEPQDTPNTETVLQAARQVVQDTSFATLITIDQTGQPKARTVDAFAPGADWVVWIATRPSSRKVTEITQTPQVTVHYYSDALKSYVSLMGEASLVSEIAIKKRMRRSQDSKKLYPNFPDDYQLIRIQPTRLEGILPGFRGHPKTWEPIGVNFP